METLYFLQFYAYPSDLDPQLNLDNLKQWLSLVNLLHTAHSSTVAKNRAEDTNSRKLLSLRDVHTSTRCYCVYKAFSQTTMLSTYTHAGQLGSLLILPTLLHKALLI